MKNLLTTLSIILLFATLPNKAFSQKYQPFPTKCATWEVYRCWYFYQPGWHDKYTLTLDGSDTIYNGGVYKKINIIQHHLPGTIYDSLHAPVFFGGMRETNKQIYIFQIWASVDTMPQLVYDFRNTNVGDTIYTKALAGSKQSYGHIVLSVDSVLVGPNYHKRMYLRDTGSIFNTEYWIEGIGSSWGLPFATFWSITDNSYDLSCFNTTKKVVYQNPSPTFGMCSGTLPTITCDSNSACDTVDFCHLKKSIIQTGNLLKSAQDSARYQWMDCSTMSPLSGDTLQSFSASSNGSYAVIVEKGECIDTSSCVEVSGLGMNDISLKKYRVYPVPSNGRIYIDLGEKESNVEIEILNLQGQKIEFISFKNVSKTEFEIQSPKGIYMLNIKTGKKNTVFKIIKN